MTVKDLVVSVDSNKFSDYLRNVYYAKAAHGDYFSTAYKRVLAELAIIAPVENTTNVSVHIGIKQVDCISETEIFGRIGTSPDKYSLSFCSWPQWLGYYISDATLATDESEDKMETLAYIMSAMCCHGFSVLHVKQNIDEQLEPFNLTAGPQSERDAAKVRNNEG